MTPPPGPGPDIELEGEVRAMLRRRAADVQVGGLAPGLPAGRRPSPGAAARPGHGPPPARLAVLAAALVLVVAVAAVLVTERGGGDDEPIMAEGRDPAAVEVVGVLEVDDLPALDLASVPALWTADEPAIDVATAYLSARLRTGPGRSLAVEPGEVQGPRWASVSWSLDGGRPTSPPVPATGTTYLRRHAAGWSVVATLSGGVDLTTTARRGGALLGSVESTTDGSLAVDVTDLDGVPVPGSPNLDGAASGPGGPPLGTAARSAERPVTVDVPVPDGQPAVLRVSHLDGDQEPRDLSEIAFPPEPDLEDESETATTFSPPFEEPDVAHVWSSAPGQPGQVVSPEEAASRFVSERAGVEVVAAEAAGPDGTGAVEVVATVPGGARVRVDLEPAGGLWLVVEVGGGGVALATLDGVPTPTWDRSRVPPAADTYSTDVRDRGRGWRDRYSAGVAADGPGPPLTLPGTGPPPGDIGAAVVVWRDGAGQVVGIAANPL